MAVWQRVRNWLGLAQPVEPVAPPPVAGPRPVDWEQEALARQALERLLAEAPGRLRLVTVNHVCQSPPRVPVTADEQAACAAWVAAHLDSRFANQLANPAHFVQAAITELRGPDAAGRLTACTAEGHRMVGLPSALLRRLQEVAEWQS